MDESDPWRDTEPRATCAREVMFRGNSRIPCRSPCRSSSHPCVRLEPTLPIRPTVTAAKSPLNWTGPTARRREHLKIIKERATLLAHRTSHARTLQRAAPPPTSRVRAHLLAHAPWPAPRASLHALRSQGSRAASSHAAQPRARAALGTYHTSALRATPSVAQWPCPGFAHERPRRHQAVAASSSRSAGRGRRPLRHVVRAGASRR